MPSAISLCSGVGGLDLAFEMAGIHVTHMIEWNAFCCDVLRARFPDSTIIHGSIEDERNLPYADVVFGGIPCQPYSVAGKQEGFTDERNLWPAAFRIIQQVRPRAVLIENVRGSITGEDNLTDYVLGDLESIGYAGGAFLVPASVFGAPHERYRAFTVAYAAAERCEPLRRNRVRTPFSGIRGASRAVVKPGCAGREKLHAAAVTDYPGYASRRSAAQRSRRLSQPGICRNFNGTSARLDEFGGITYANAKKTRSSENLFTLRERTSTQNVWRKARRSKRIFTAQVLRSSVFSRSEAESGRGYKRVAQTCIETPQVSMRSVQYERKFTGTPYRQQSGEQRPFKFDDVVRLMSLEMALGTREINTQGACNLQDLWSATQEIAFRDVPKTLSALQKIWQPLPDYKKVWIAVRACGGRLDYPFPAGQGTFQYSWEPPRTVETKAPFHKERVQALGNAVVWMQAYPLAQAIHDWLVSYAHA